MADEQVKLDENPESTWGASEEYKARWQQQFGGKSEEAAQTSAPGGVPRGGASTPS